MNFTKDRANVCKTCTCDDRLKAERALFWLVHNFFQIHKSFLWFQHNSTKEWYDSSRLV